MDINTYRPREVFMPLHTRGARWSVVVAHRRAGKTVAMCADLMISALQCRQPKPQYAYLAPFRDQAKKVAWNYLKELSKPVWAKPPNESELHVTIRNGHGGTSTIYVGGADHPDAWRGMYFDGVVLDEVGQIRPSAWYSVLRPALSDRRGWAIFAGTPAGKNFFWQMREEARLNPKTHLLLELPASKTKILHPDELRDARAQMTDETYATEYEVSFDAAVPGAYYAKLIGEAYETGRVGQFPVDKEFAVDLVADLGYTDSCSWWGWQTTLDGYKLVDFYEADGREIGHYINWVKSRPYKVGTVYLPHDARAKSLQTGKSIIEQFLSAGITPQIVPELGLQDGIEAARLVLPKCWFDETATYDGIEHLRGYMREWDERTQTFRSRPKHDQHSHCFVAGTMVSTPGGLRPIEGLKVGDVVNTPAGVRPVDAVMSSMVEETLELQFDNGAVVRCTEDHPFVTDCGIVRADALGYSHHVDVEAPCVRSTKFRSSTAFGFTSSLAAITKRTTSRWGASAFSCTGMSGSISTVRSRLGTMFTTGTGTSPTTLSKIWSACLGVSISRVTRARKLFASLGGGMLGWNWRERLRGIGIPVMRADAGTVSTVFVSGLGGSYASINARTAARFTRPFAGRLSAGVGFVPTPASLTLGSLLASITKRVGAAYAAMISFVTGTPSARPAARLVRVRRLPGRVRVYDLTVRHEHVFYANGLLVGNCADAFRYLALAAKRIKGREYSSGVEESPTWVRNAYSFRLDDIWDCQPMQGGRIG